MGEAQIFWFHCEIKLLRSASALNPRIQVEIKAANISCLDRAICSQRAHDPVVTDSYRSALASMVENGYEYL